LSDCRTSASKLASVTALAFDMISSFLGWEN
jgi:hypothetical protein